ncbi:MAG: bifunctional hydroxymethylpyrimidine kinase/phosphomethylpyrimidine kinase [Ruminococcus sp.]|nr:bifunctional hydroxymethylpyrimidine kinase/phosphomethylpyrimidine kinase [Ruminococcus sp.]
MKKVLTIAGSDSSGGAGIQADIKTMTIHGVYAMSVITALTAQNTTGVMGIHEIPTDFTAKQIDMIFSDIRPDSVKTGMIPNAETAEVVAERLKYWKAENIVVDPVYVATSGSSLSTKEAYEMIKNMLLPIATLVTPNIPEAELITGIKISCAEDMEQTAKFIYEKYGCAVLVKGGHSLNTADDFLYTKNKSKIWFEGIKINNPNTHGTGCTLSSAIASNLAKGYTLEKSVRLAKEYITSCLSAMLDIGHGNGPLNHMKGTE